MKKILFLFTAIVLLGSCASTKKNKNQSDVVRSEKQLKSDIDFAYKKLQKLHPNLYWYISKEQLDFKFDSLKSSINAPMSNNDFYFALSPVIASIKQGHTRLFPPINEEINNIIKKDVSPLSQFDFERIENKLYIIKDRSGDKGVKSGTEIISINNISPQETFSKWSKTFSSDGFNQTFENRIFSKNFITYFHMQNGILDSAICKLKYNDTIKTLHIRRKPIGVSVKKEVARKQKVTVTKKTYNKELSFLEPDSSIALLKMKTFTDTYGRFYKNSFRKLNSSKTKILILDLRDNTGGRLRAAYNLYSYLVDGDFYFIDKPEVATKTSFFHTNYFRKFIKAPLIGKVFFVAFSPIKLAFTGVNFFKVKKGPENKYFYSFSYSKISHPKPDNFKGQIFILINGGTFSGSCTLSSNLKGSKRAIFVGEETGGVYNGCVAGKITSFNLPKSELPLVFGLALVQPHFKTDTEGRGIFPDIEIKPTIQDRKNGIDPELKWVLDEIKGLHTSSFKK